MASNEQEKLRNARQLLKQKKYDEARNILEEIPTNPKAQQWLKQLDERYPKGTAQKNEKPIQAESDIEAPQVSVEAGFSLDIILGKLAALPAATKIGGAIIIIGLIFFAGLRLVNQESAVPSEVRETIEDFIEEEFDSPSLFDVPENWIIRSAQQATDPDNASLRIGSVDELWCAVINPPIIYTSMAGVAEIKHFLVKREALLWDVHNAGSPYADRWLEDLFPRVGCSNYAE